MEPGAFAHQVCAWLDPNAVGDALISLQRPILAEAQIQWTWHSQDFESAANVGLDYLVRLFLDNFHVPLGYIRLLRSISSPDISLEAWQWLLSLRFAGEPTFSDFPTDSKPDTVVLIKERYAAVLVLQAPLSFLCNVVGQIARTWLPYAGGGERPRPGLEHSGTGELSAYVESVVASRIVNAAAIGVAIGPAKATMNMDYRSISHAGPYPSSRQEIEPLRELARSYASQWGAIE
jgi:hypothetical protein